MDKQPLQKVDQMPENGRKNSPVLLFSGLLVGLALGVLAMIAYARHEVEAGLAKALASKQPATVARPAQVTPKPESAKVEPDKPAPTEPAKPSTEPAKQDKAPKPISSPMSPFDGVIGISPEHPKGWGGGVPDPKIEAKVAETSDGTVRLIEMLVPENARGQVSGLASQAHASSATITDYRGDSFIPADGLLIHCPPAQTQALLDKIGKAGGTPGIDWRGIGSERDQIAVQHAVNALQDLQRRRQDLLARYYEDAIPVKELDDQISAVTEAMKKYRRKDSAKSDAIKVVFIKG